MIRSLFAGVSCALLLTGCDKVVRIGTSLPEQSSSGGASGGAAADSGVEPDMTDVVNAPAQAGTGSAPNTDCSSAVAATPRWSFDIDTEGWQLSNPSAATLNWSDAQGMPAPGALLIAGDEPPGDDLFVFIPVAVPDLSSTIATFNVLLESGDDLNVKLFAQSGDDYSWADGGIVPITAGAWTCIALDLEAPAYRTSGFDPSLVRRLGIGFSGTGFRAFLDELSY